MKKSAFVMKEMIRYFEGDIKRINHLIKVFGFAKTLGELERIDSYTQEIIEIAALTHDIGIKKSEEKYNSSSGHYQQIEGPNEARMLLRHIEIEDELIERVCWLIAHHHTYIGKYQPVVIGIDHGFSLIKSYHHIMSNGVAKTSGKPPVLENSLYYNGNYYAIGGSRMTVNEDKTENDTVPF